MPNEPAMRLSTPRSELRHVDLCVDVEAGQLAVGNEC